MARIRSLKPGFFTNEDLAELPFEHRLCFAGLWTLADREGRLEDRPRRIKAALFPYDDVDMNSMLQALADKGFVLRYIADGAACLAIPTFAQHQRPRDDEPASVLPSAPGVRAYDSDAPKESGVYFVWSAKRVKIGYSQDIPARLASLKPIIPDMKVLGVIRSETSAEAKNLESRFHRQFHHLRLSNEWFSCTSELTAFIHANKSDRRTSVSQIIPQKEVTDSTQGRHEGDVREARKGDLDLGTGNLTEGCADGAHVLADGASSGEAADVAGAQRRAEDFKDLWNELTHVPIPRCRDLTAKRRRQIRTRLSERSWEQWGEVFIRIQAASFCRGETDRSGWRASFDWVIGSPDVAVKVLEGKYDDRAPTGTVWTCPDDPPCPVGTSQFRCHQRAQLEAARKAKRT